MVQEAISSLTTQLLDNVPVEHRSVISEYVLRFKDAYLTSLSGKSGKLGIFALAILIWVGLQTFNNIDRTINFIWSSDHERPFFEKVRNFLVVAVAAPIVILASLSIPIMLKNISPTKQLFVSLPWAYNFINFIIPVSLVLGTFTLLYRFVPVRQVQWKAAIGGATFSALLLQFANIGMRFYFRVGTTSAYGKAAVVPLLGFWLYLVWIIIIAGAEVSYLTQNEKFIVRATEIPPSFYEGECLLAIILLLHKNHIEALGPVTFTEVFNHTHLDTFSLKRTLSYLESKKIVLQCLPTKRSSDVEYSLARSVADDKISEVLGDFLLKNRARVSEAPISQDFETSLNHWLAFFKEKTFASYLAAK